MWKQLKKGLKAMEKKEVLSAEEAAQFLGLNPDDVRRYARKGMMPARKVGKRWLFHKAHLIEWLKGNTHLNVEAE
jgi:excisionase family DNA binding protein